MEKNEVLLWTLTVIRASKGDKENQEMLDVENKMRADQGRPSVEEELRAIHGQAKK